MTETAPISATLQRDSLDHSSASDPPCLSQRLILALEAHLSAEAHDLSLCAHLAQTSPDPVVRLLIGLIVEDEPRHRRLLQSMLRGFQRAGDLAPWPTEAPLPNGSAQAENEIAVTLRGLIRDEHEGARHIRYLARQEPQLYAGLYPLLLEIVARDSEKHATILRFLLRYVEDRQSS